MLLHFKYLYKNKILILSSQDDVIEFMNLKRTFFHHQTSTFGDVFICWMDRENDLTEEKCFRQMAKVKYSRKIYACVCVWNTP